MLGEFGSPEKDDSAGRGHLLFVIKGSCLNRSMNTGLENLAWGLAETGWTVSILSGGRRPTEIRYEIPERVTYLFTGVDGLGLAHLDWFRRISKNDVDFVIGWTRAISPLIQNAERHSGFSCRFIAHEGSQASVSRKRILLRRLKSILSWFPERSDTETYQSDVAMKSLRHIAHVVAISKVVADKSIKAYGYPKSKVSVIHRGIDTNLFEPGGNCYDLDKSGNPIILFTGNINRQKGLIDAAKAIAKVEVPLTFKMIGVDFLVLSEVRRIISEGNPRHQVIFSQPLPQSELVVEIRKASAFIFLSKSEGLGKSLLEAMSCGIVPIVPRSQPFTSFVRDLDNGFLVDPRKHHKVAKVIQRLVSDASIRERMGQSARQTVLRDFDRNREINAWDELLLHFSD